MHNLRLGFFLGLRQIQQANLGTSALIITVVVFTFINLVAVSGIFNGIIDGVVRDTSDQGLGDVILGTIDNKGRIEDTQRLIRELEQYPQVKAVSPRFEELGIIEANYENVDDVNEERDQIAVTIDGVDPEREEATMGLSSLIQEGSYFEPNDREVIIIGKHYIEKHAKEYGEVFDYLNDVEPGDKVRLTIGDTTREFTVKGILDSKIDLVSLSVFIPETDLRRMTERIDFDADRIMIRLHNEADTDQIIQVLDQAGFSDVADIRSFTLNVPKYIQDVATTFEILGLTIGAISVIVASITVFIIIFIQIVSKRRQVGILKAIGIKRRVLEYAYMTQSGFYAISGIAIGTLIIFLILIPYFEVYPIDFPYTDVSLSVSLAGMVARGLLLFIIMLIAGLVPAYLIARQNTVNAILGRK